MHADRHHVLIQALRLLRVLAQGPATRQALAEQLGVHERTVRRALYAWRAAGLPLAQRRRDQRFEFRIRRHRLGLRRPQARQIRLLRLRPVATRADPRYVASDSPHALLRAWGGPDGTVDMGGWTDLDHVAFEAAVQDESLHSAGERLSHVSIHAVERDGRPSGHQDRPEERTP